MIDFLLTDRIAKESWGMTRLRTIRLITLFSKDEIGLTDKVSMNYLFISLICIFLLPLSQANDCPFGSTRNTNVNNKSRVISSVNTDSSKENDFHLVVRKVEDTYKSTFVKKSLRLVIRKNWEDWVAKAEMDYSKKQAIIYIGGGHLREAEIDKDAFTIIMCHEIGHLIGGYPLHENDSRSVEGQADYFATSKCIKRIWRNDLENIKAAEFLLPNAIKTECSNQYTGDSYYICLRTMKAAEKLGAYFNKNDDRGAFRSLDMPDKRNLGYTWPGASFSQCRVDTFVQGALCNVNPHELMSPENELDGACSTKKGNSIGSRPKCWFLN